MIKVLLDCKKPKLHKLDNLSKVTTKRIETTSPRKFYCTFTQHINRQIDVVVQIYENNNSTSLIEIGKIPNFNNDGVITSIATDYLGNIGIFRIISGILYAKLPTISSYKGFASFTDLNGALDNFFQ